MCGRGSSVATWLRANRPGISDFSLSGGDSTLFIYSQWPAPQFAFLAYRTFMACYVTAWLIMSIVNAGKTTGLGGIFVFLTNWSFIVLSVYFTIASVATIYATYKHRTGDRSPSSQILTMDSNANPQPDINVNRLMPFPSTDVPPQEGTLDSAPTAQTPVYFKITWALLNVCLTVHPIISIVYWGFIFNPEFVYTNQGGSYGVALTVHRHAFNTIFTYFDLAVTATPIKFWHFVYPCVYCVIYVAFSLVYFWAGGVNPYLGTPAIYPILLDWTTPGRTVPILLGALVVLVLFHSMAYGCYRLRIHVADRLFGSENLRSSTVLRNHLDTECNTIA